MEEKNKIKVEIEGKYNEIQHLVEIMGVAHIA